MGAFRVFPPCSPTGLDLCLQNPADRLVSHAPLLRNQGEGEFRNYFDSKLAGAAIPLACGLRASSGRALLSTLVRSRLAAFALSGLLPALANLSAHLFVLLFCSCRKPKKYFSGPLHQVPTEVARGTQDEPRGGTHEIHRSASTRAPPPGNHPAYLRETLPGRYMGECQT